MKGILRKKERKQRGQLDTDVGRYVFFTFYPCNQKAEEAKSKLYVCPFFLFCLSSIFWFLVICGTYLPFQLLLNRTPRRKSNNSGSGGRPGQSRAEKKILGGEYCWCHLLYHLTAEKTAIALHLHLHLRRTGAFRGGHLEVVQVSMLILPHTVLIPTAE